jgi:hypothetical protein
VIIKFSEKFYYFKYIDLLAFQNQVIISFEISIRHCPGLDSENTYGNQINVFCKTAKKFDLCEGRWNLPVLLVDPLQSEPTGQTSSDLHVDGARGLSYDWFST